MGAVRGTSRPSRCARRWGSRQPVSPDLSALLTLFSGRLDTAATGDCGDPERGDCRGRRAKPEPHERTHNRSPAGLDLGMAGSRAHWLGT